MAEQFSHLPPLESVYRLSGEQVKQFQTDGHIMLRGLATSDEVAAYRPYIRSILEEVTERKAKQGRPGGYASFFAQVTNIWRLHDATLRFVIARRFARVAAELMGAPGVRLYHDQALFKPAGGKATPWHQDQVYWPLDTPRTITMWMPLVDLTREMGTMVFAAGSHREGPLTQLAISDASDAFFDRLVRDRGFPLQSYDLKAGDATFHGGWTAHATHPNSSNSVREVMTIIYYADGARIVEPDNDYRRVDLEAFHPGQRPGEPAASALNPLLYSNVG